jgi:hypothetical protein
MGILDAIVDLLVVPGTGTARWPTASILPNHCVAASNFASSAAWFELPNTKK